MKIISSKAGDTILKKGTSANQKIVVIIEGSLKKVFLLNKKLIINIFNKKIVKIRIICCF